MGFYERYINGEDGRSVYDDIYDLGEEAFNDQHSNDVQAVLTETFERVAFNLDIIYMELKRIGYVFKTDFQFNSDRPLSEPLADTDKLIVSLENAVKHFGYVPLSLKYFYGIVGACNFAWDYETEPKLYWKYADPIQVAALDDVVSEVFNDDWSEFMVENLEITCMPFIELAADYFHKDNVSGGPPYSIQLTPKPSIDSLFLNEENNTTFIDYLRICMENCGFPKITTPEYQNDYRDFFEKVKPQLKRI